MADVESRPVWSVSTSSDELVIDSTGMLTRVPDALVNAFPEAAHTDTAGDLIEVLAHALNCRFDVDSRDAIVRAAMVSFGPGSPKRARAPTHLLPVRALSPSRRGQRWSTRRSRWNDCERHLGMRWQSDGMHYPELCTAASDPVVHEAKLIQLLLRLHNAVRGVERRVPDAVVILDEVIAGGSAEASAETSTNAEASTEASTNTNAETSTSNTVSEDITAVAREAAAAGVTATPGQLAEYVAQARAVQDVGVRGGGEDEDILQAGWREVFARRT